MKNFLFVLFLCLIGSGIYPMNIHAQWSTDPKVNNPICTTATQQQLPRVVSDGSGGAIITWWNYDNLITNDYNIYAQRIDSAGIVRWDTNGVPICTNPLLQMNPMITSDGNGGAIIAWQDNRSGRADIYAQRINASGIVQWAADGIAVCADTLDQTVPQLISDGSGGAIITWRDLRDGISYIPYAQKLNADGVAQWTAGGVLLSQLNGESLQIVSDGNGGAIIAWHQYTGVYPNGNFDIIVQQINTNGIIGWGNDGVAICSLTSEQFRPQLIRDAGSGTTIVWEDQRNGSSYNNLYAQKVDSGGVAQWALNGVAIAPNTLSQIEHKLLSDGSGGIFITWQYASGGLINTIYAQRMNSSGVSQWASDGVSIGAAGESRFPEITTDGGTGAIITWYDYRGWGNGDIFAQRINSAGAVQWIVNGVGVCRDPSGQVFPQLVKDGSGGAIITWDDSRNSATNSTDIYAQRVGASGTLGGVTGVNEHDHSLPATYVLEQNYPNPFNPATVISYQLPVNSQVTLKVFDVLGREVATLVNENKKSGSYEVEFSGSKLPSGMYFYRLQAGSFVETKKLLLMK
jgi:hypothetical protein